MIELPIERYRSLDKHLDEIIFNHLFARAVIEGSVSGRVYVDGVNDPRSFYIVHRYGMSLLFGDPTNTEFNSAFRDYSLNINRARKDHEWMQVFPDEWNAILQKLLGDKLIRAKDNIQNAQRSVVELNTRVNFLFDRGSYLRNREGIVKDPGIRIAETTNEIYDQMSGSVVPRAFWNSSGDFIDKGISFSAYCGDTLAATAFSSFVAPGKLELGIETLTPFRGQGLAERVCSALIDLCRERELEPIWACRLENIGSYKLAKNLGFIPSLELPYYRLSN